MCTCSLSSRGWLQVPSPTGCPGPRGGCAGTPGSYSERWELGTGMGMFLNRGLQFTCTRVVGRLLGSIPRGPTRRGDAAATSPRCTQGRHHRWGAGTATKPVQGCPLPSGRGHGGRSQQCHRGHLTPARPLAGPQHRGHRRATPPRGGVPAPAASTGRIQPARGPGRPARARLRLHRITPSSSSSCCSPHPAWKGTQASGPAPALHRAPAAARGPVGPGGRGLGPPGLGLLRALPVPTLAAPGKCAVRRRATGRGGSRRPREGTGIGGTDADPPALTGCGASGVHGP